MVEAIETQEKGYKLDLFAALAANARLIAAAPILFDELNRALAALRNPQAFNLETVCLGIEEAIAKARGGAE